MSWGIWNLLREEEKKISSRHKIFIKGEAERVLPVSNPAGKSSENVINAVSERIIHKQKIKLIFFSLSLLFYSYQFLSFLVFLSFLYSNKVLAQQVISIPHPLVFIIKLDYYEIDEDHSVNMLSKSIRQKKELK